MKKIFLFLLIAFSISAYAQSPAGNWQGNIKTPGPSLKIIVKINGDAGSLTGTMDIPEQGANDLQLADLKLNQKELSFLLPDVPGDVKFKGTWHMEKDSIIGIFYQAGMEMKMVLGKQKANNDKPELSQFAKLLKIEAYADSLLKKGKIAGMSVGIIKNGEIIMNRGFGYRDLENKIKVDHKTLFAIGSSSKAFTTAVMGILADEEKLDWEKPIKKYMPDFKMYDPFATDQITATDLISHRSGLPRHDFAWYGSNATRKELVERIQYLEPSEPFRTKWQYQNFMFLTAGVLCEEITGEKWEELVKKKIFAPLEMNHSMLYFNEVMKAENLSLPYKTEEGKIVKTDYRNIDAMGPAGSIYSNSTDMLNWLKMHLDEGKFKDKAIISESQLAFLHAPKMLMPMSPSEKDIKMSSYAAGWMIDLYKDKTIVHHGGNIDGFSAEVFMIPEENLGIVVLTNKDGTNIGELMSMYAADVILGHEERDWFEEKIGAQLKMAQAQIKADEEAEAKNKKKEKEKPKLVKKSPPHHALASYAGDFENPGYGIINVKFENGKLSADYNGFKMEMEHDQFECFKAANKATGMEIKLTYFTNSSGKVESFYAGFEPSVDELKFLRKPVNYLKDENYLALIMGDYDFGGMNMTIKKEGTKLFTALSDGQKYELEPSGENLFALKGLKGFNMEFIFDSKGKCIEVSAIQPNGTFNAKRKS